MLSAQVQAVQARPTVQVLAPLAEQAPSVHGFATSQEIVPIGELGRLHKVLLKLTAWLLDGHLLCLCNDGPLLHHSVIALGEPEVCSLVTRLAVDAETLDTSAQRFLTGTSESVLAVTNDLL